MRPDAIIFDLEDSAGEGEKHAGREALRAHLALHPAFPDDPVLRILRVNPPGTPDGEADLALGATGGFDAVLVPKVESPQTLAETDERLMRLGASPTLAIWAMVETPKGVRDVAAISQTPLTRPLGALVVGPNDLVAAADLLPSPGRPELMPWLGPILVAGRAAGIPVLDGVYADLADPAGFEAECRQGRAYGFSGKTLIHPSQVDPANQAFSPTVEDIAVATAIVAAFSDPAYAERGVVRHAGRMVERLHLQAAERLLARVALIQERSTR